MPPRPRTLSPWPRLPAPRSKPPAWLPHRTADVGRARTPSATTSHAAGSTALPNRSSAASHSTSTWAHTPVRAAQHEPERRPRPEPPYYPDLAYLNAHSLRRSSRAVSGMLVPLESPGTDVVVVGSRSRSQDNPHEGRPRPTNRPEGSSKGDADQLPLHPPNAPGFFWSHFQRPPDVGPLSDATESPSPSRRLAQRVVSDTSLTQADVERSICTLGKAEHLSFTATDFGLLSAALLSRGLEGAALLAGIQLLEVNQPDRKGKAPALHDTTQQALAAVFEAACPRASTRSGHRIASRNLTRLQHLWRLVTQRVDAGATASLCADAYIRGLLSVGSKERGFRAELHAASEALVGQWQKPAASPVSPAFAQTLALSARILLREIKIRRNSLGKNPSLATDVPAGDRGNDSREGDSDLVDLLRALETLACFLGNGEAGAPAFSTAPLARTSTSATRPSDGPHLLDSLVQTLTWAAALPFLTVQPPSRHAAFDDDAAHSHRHIVQSLDRFCVRLDSNRCAPRLGLPSLTTLIKYVLNAPHFGRAQVYEAVGSILRGLRASGGEPDSAIVNVLLRGSASRRDPALMAASLEACWQESRRVYREVQACSTGRHDEASARPGGPSVAGISEEEERGGVGARRKLSPLLWQLEVAVWQGDSHRIAALLRLVRLAHLYEHPGAHLESRPGNAPPRRRGSSVHPARPTPIEVRLASLGGCSVQRLVLQLLPSLETCNGRLVHRRVRRLQFWGAPARELAWSSDKVSPATRKFASRLARRRRFDRARFAALRRLETAALSPHVLSELLQLVVAAGRTGLAERIWTCVLRQSVVGRWPRAVPPLGLSSPRPMGSVALPAHVVWEAGSATLRLYAQEAKKDGVARRMRARARATHADAATASATAASLAPRPNLPKSLLLSPRLVRHIERRRASSLPPSQATAASASSSSAAAAAQAPKPPLRSHLRRGWGRTPLRLPLRRGADERTDVDAGAGGGAAAAAAHDEAELVRAWSILEAAALRADAAVVSAWLLHRRLWKAWRQGLLSKDEDAGSSGGGGGGGGVAARRRREAALDAALLDVFAVRLRRFQHGGAEGAVEERADVPPDDDGGMTSVDLVDGGTAPSSAEARRYAVRVLLADALGAMRARGSELGARQAWLGQEVRHLGRGT